MRCWGDFLNELDGLKSSTHRPQQSRQRYASGGSVSNRVKKIAAEGRGGDTKLARVGPRTARILDDVIHNGRVQRNPRTGLREYMLPAGVQPWGPDRVPTGRELEQAAAAALPAAQDLSLPPQPSYQRYLGNELKANHVFGAYPYDELMSDERANSTISKGAKRKAATTSPSDLNTHIFGTPETMKDLKRFIKSPETQAIFGQQGITKFYPQNNPPERFMRAITSGGIGHREISGADLEKYGIPIGGKIASHPKKSKYLIPNHLDPIRVPPEIGKSFSPFTGPPKKRKTVEELLAGAK